MPKNEIIVHLPTLGRPYIVQNKTTELEDLQEMVAYPEKEGLIEYVNNKYMVIHPLFVASHKYWKLAEELIKCECKLWANEEGLLKKYDYNLACMCLLQGKPLNGEIIIVISNKQYKKVSNKLGYKLNKYDFNDHPLFDDSD